MIREEEAREVLAGRRARGAALSERQREVDTVAKDWYGTCKACGEKRTGTMAELRQPHDCEVTDG